MTSEEEAYQLVKNTSKYAHALLVSAIMAEIVSASKTAPWHKTNIMKRTELGLS